MKVTLELPDELVASLPKNGRARNAAVVNGLTQQRRRQRNEVSDWRDVVDFFATNPTPEQIVALRSDPARTKRIQTLLAKNQDAGLNPSEEAEMDALLAVEHAVSLAKARALAKLNGPPPKA